MAINQEEQPKYCSNTNDWYDPQDPDCVMENDIIAGEMIPACFANGSVVSDSSAREPKSKHPNTTPKDGK
jgi:hypothetical protein